MVLWDYSAGLTFRQSSWIQYQCIWRAMACGPFRRLASLPSHTMSWSIEEWSQHNDIMIATPHLQTCANTSSYPLPLNVAITMMYWIWSTSECPPEAKIQQQKSPAGPMSWCRFTKSLSTSISFVLTWVLAVYSVVYIFIPTIRHMEPKTCRNLVSGCHIFFKKHEKLWLRRAGVSWICHKGRARPVQCSNSPHPVHCHTAPVEIDLWCPWNPGWLEGRKPNKDVQYIYIYTRDRSRSPVTTMGWGGDGMMTFRAHVHMFDATSVCLSCYGDHGGVGMGWWRSVRM